MNIHVGRYEIPTDTRRAKVEAEHPGCQFPSDTWEGWIEPDDRSWIIFVGTDHKPLVFLNRDEGGGIRD